MSAFAQDSTTIPSVNEEMLVLSLVINWRSKRVLNLNRKTSLSSFCPSAYPEQSVPRIGDATHVHLP